MVGFIPADCWKVTPVPILALHQCGEQSYGETNLHSKRCSIDFTFTPEQEAFRVHLRNWLERNKTEVFGRDSDPIADRQEDGDSRWQKMLECHATPITEIPPGAAGRGPESLGVRWPA